tara:strand:- start:4789 stop:6054 length:1266 start_codon:yes stop_codon:yes gene_type:complete
MGSIIDRRKNSSGKSHGNKRRFLKRIEGQIKKAIPNIVADKSLKGLSDGDGRIKIPIKGTKEPRFVYDKDSGRKKYVLPGNDKFVEGDRIPRPERYGGAGGNKGSKDGKGEDEFVVTISKEEFIEYFFEDLELPDLVKKTFSEIFQHKKQRAGFVKDGVPSRLNIVKSVKESLKRKIGIVGSLKRKLKELEEELENTTDADRIIELQGEIEIIQKRIDTIPYIDEVDLRYNHFENRPEPTTQAVMFAIMDVSASMGMREKDICKRFFTLLYLFLFKSYQKVEMVFIRHHSESKECEEEEFFNSKETGGTRVAPAIELMKKIIYERYLNANWNIYCCQASDGDTWDDIDAWKSRKILEEDLLPHMQYMAYIEVCRSYHTLLWSEYTVLHEEFSNFASEKVADVSEIWTVFRKLFRKRGVKIK